MLQRCGRRVRSCVGSGHRALTIGRRRDASRSNTKRAAARRNRVSDERDGPEHVAGGSNAWDRPMRRSPMATSRSASPRALHAWLLDSARWQLRRLGRPCAFGGCAPTDASPPRLVAHRTSSPPDAFQTCPSSFSYAATRPRARRRRRFHPYVRCCSVAHTGRTSPFAAIKPAALARR